VRTGKPRRSRQQFVVAAQLGREEDGRFVVHAAADIVLGAQREHRGEGPASSWTGTETLTDSWTGGVYDRLFHGPAFQGLECVEAVGPDGLVVRSRLAPAPTEWLAEPWRTQWIADPLALDSALQAVILWSLRYRGEPCLPCSLDSYRQFARSFPRDGVRIRVRIDNRPGATIHAAIEFWSLTGELVSCIGESRHVVDGGLAAAFLRNQMAAQEG
jgi:hypothetical protein